ncbi:MAG TPA: glycosyltransferase family 2 protein [Spirochaetota bacterium]|nr:glycosyltransferase family 2 protein [Spirochaetota bacterium]HPC41351.1 glycosyltransferase family 2 protein [Spirochaetota bacterium]HPL15446.1 glycosyltransferase family 2 protein [Spirochaetota bacterium]HQF09718.1 glycosyltransferase family 2 protein [Spirochaetota bacterium]HQH99458.1 glycosyltransferase family 2 protein [Spirochaetota bacterium]
MPAKKSATKLIVVVPAYNEAERIGDTLKALRSIHGKLKKQNIDLYLYVVDDGSKDDTRAVAQAAGADRILRHKINQGLGAAIRTGLTAADKDGADIVIKFDADLQHDPNDIVELIKPILEDSADVVYGNRFNRIEYRMPFVRHIGNKVFTGLMRFLTGWPLKDSQPGIFAINRDYLSVFSLPGDYNYTQQILLDSYHKGMRFAHVDVSFRKRVTGKSFISLKYPFKVGFQILMVLVIVSPMKIFGTAGLLFLFSGLIVFVVELIMFFIGNSPKPVVHVNAVMGCLFMGLQTLFFGLLAEIIKKITRNR